MVTSYLQMVLSFRTCQLFCRWHTLLLLFILGIYHNQLSSDPNHLAERISTFGDGTGLSLPHIANFSINLCLSFIFSLSIANQQQSLCVHVYTHAFQLGHFMFHFMSLCACSPIGHAYICKCVLTWCETVCVVSTAIDHVCHHSLGRASPKHNT